MDLDEELREAGERWRRGRGAGCRLSARDGRASYRYANLGRSRMLVRSPAVAANALVLTGAVWLFAHDASSPKKVVVTQPTFRRAPDAPSVLTLDPEIVQTGALAIDGASVWVTGDAPLKGRGDLEHIDTATGNVMGKSLLPDNGPFQIVVGDNAIWVASQQERESSAHVTKVDPTTMRVTAVIETAGDAVVAVTPDAQCASTTAPEPAAPRPRYEQGARHHPVPGAPSGYTAHFITVGSLGIFLDQLLHRHSSCAPIPRPTPSRRSPTSGTRG